MDKDLKDYVMRSKHDAVVFGGASKTKGPPIGCKGKAFLEMHKELFSILPGTMYVPPVELSSTPLSINRCGSETNTRPFQLTAFS